MMTPKGKVKLISINLLLAILSSIIISELFFKIIRPKLPMEVFGKSYMERVPREVFPKVNDLLLDTF